MNFVRVKEKSNNYTVAFFLYATLIVDLIRKIGWGNVHVVRDVIYILVFLFIICSVYRLRNLVAAMFVALGVSCIYIVSFLINSSYPELYLTSWTLFIMRLWPAYIIGRYLKDWDSVLNAVRHLIWIAFIYSILIIISPEVTKASYITVASNLIYVVLLATYSSVKQGKWFSLLLCVVCWLPMLLYGSRTMLFGILGVFFLSFLLSLKRMSFGKQLVVMTLLIVCVIIIAINFDTLFKWLYDVFPTSRTLQYLVAGDIFDDSNRFVYYDRIKNSLSLYPFKVYGFLGDRIYYAEQSVDILSAGEIESMYSHNVPLELCMNFGLLPGVFLNLYFMYKIVRCFGMLSKGNGGAFQIVFVIFLGVTLVNMIVSVSYLNEYSIWLIIGLVFHILGRHNTKEFCQLKC